jgi:hypothetical protein
MSSTHPVRAVRQTEELPRRSWEWADNEGRFSFIFSFVQGWAGIGLFEFDALHSELNSSPISTQRQNSHLHDIVHCTSAVHHRVRQITAATKKRNPSYGNCTMLPHS